MKRAWTSAYAGILSALMVVAGGCAAGQGCAWGGAKYAVVKTSTVPQETFERVDVATENGAISIRQADGPITVSATIRATTQARADATTVTAVKGEDGVLMVRVDWPGGKRERNEGAAIELVVPVLEGAKAHASNGAIAIAGLSGDASIKTTNGRITVQCVGGNIDAETSNGRVEVAGAASVRVRTSNGRVQVILADDASGPADIRTSNGSISLDVGKSFNSVVQGSTSNGRVTLLGTSHRGEGEVKFGEGRHASTLRSSNGSIDLKAR